MTREEKAIAFHDKGYNCCQSVACAFCDDLGVDAKTVFAAGEGFGAGMGGMDGTCGALSGAVMVAGMKNSDANLDAPKSKGATYKFAKAIHLTFGDKVGSTICREIKGVDTGCPKTSCADCIRLGVRIAEEILEIQ